MSSRSKSSSEGGRPKGLPSHLAVLCKMLRSPDEKRRCAAAMVLAEIVPRETLVVEALGEVLVEENPTLTSYALEALEKIGSRAALPYLLPLLEREEGIRRRAERAIGSLGEPALTDVCRELAQAPKDRRRPLITLLVNLDGRGALKAVVDALLFEEMSFVNSVIARYADKWRTLSPSERDDRRKVLLDYMGRPDVRDRVHPMLTGIGLLGALGDSVTRRSVAPYARPKQKEPVRRTALLALAKLPPPPGKEEAAFNELLELLGDDNLQFIVLPALEALGPLPTPESAAVALRDLLSSPYPPVRYFAAERLGTVSDEKAVNALLRILFDDDPGLRDRAYDALQRSPGSSTPLVRQLIAAKEPERAWPLSRLIAARAENVTASQAGKLGETAEKMGTTVNEKVEAILHALRAVDPAYHRKVVLNRGLKLLKQRKLDDAASALAVLELGAEDDPEARYALLVATLKSVPKDLDKRPRQGSRPLVLARGLLRESDFPLLKRLTADKLIDRDDLYYLGSYFAQADDAFRSFGSSLLERVVKAGPRTKLGRAAKSRLAELKPR